MSVKFWTEDEDALIKQLYFVEGRSASYVAKAMTTGRSRNSIIGRSHRLGLQRPAEFAAVNSLAAYKAYNRKPAAPRVAKPRKPNKTRKVKLEAAPVTKVGEFGVLPDMDFGRRERPTGVLFIDRTRSECAWPVGPVEEPGHAHMLVCGSPIVDDGCSYCRTHARRSKNDVVLRPINGYDPSIMKTAGLRQERAA